MDGLGSILDKRKYDAPSEIEIIKQFVWDKFEETVQVAVKPDAIVINVPNASLAGALRPQTITMQKLCKTDKRLLIRIGL